MREIKFRAWNKKKKAMMFNCGVDNHGYAIYCSRYNNDLRIDGWSDDIEILMYTGLKDKNGVEIYENDFIKVFSHIYKIYYVNYLACFQMANQDENMPNDTGFIMNTSAEVIGNIYENPELLCQDRKEN